MLKIAVDFDGCVVDHRFPRVGQDAPHAVEVLRRLRERGDRLILFTLRDGGYLESAIDWFASREISLYGIQSDPDQQKFTASPKCHFDLLIDDRAIIEKPKIVRRRTSSTITHRQRHR